MPKGRTKQLGRMRLPHHPHPVGRSPPGLGSWNWMVPDSLPAAQAASPALLPISCASPGALHKGY